MTDKLKPENVPENEKPAPQKLLSRDEITALIDERIDAKLTGHREKITDAVKGMIDDALAPVVQEQKARADADVDIKKQLEEISRALAPLSNFFQAWTTNISNIHRDIADLKDDQESMRAKIGSAELALVGQVRGLHDLEQVVRGKTGDNLTPSLYQLYSELSARVGSNSERVSVIVQYVEMQKQQSEARRQVIQKLVGGLKSNWLRNAALLLAGVGISGGWGLGVIEILRLLGLLS